MANEQNLKKNSERTPKERRELASKAGKASGKARREKADFKAAVLEMLGQDAKLEQVIEAMYKAAMKGNVQAAAFLRDTAGQKPIEQVKAENTDTVKVVLFGNEGRE